MSPAENSGMSRRDLLKNAGKVAAVSALAGVALPTVHASVDDTIQVALVGCGGRGTGAARDALRVPNGNTRLIAMADVFQNRLSSSYNTLSGGMSGVAAQVSVPPSRRFVGFDSYRQAMDALRPGDVIILATPPGFRWVHFAYAIEKRLNVFMEKPVTVDGPSTRRMLALAQQSEQLGLKVGVGLMCRHCAARGQMFDRIKNGEIGDLTLLRCFRRQGPEATSMTVAAQRQNQASELLFQIQRFHSFLWLSGGCYSDFLIHNIDECCWMKDAWPVQAAGSGGRHFKNNAEGQPYIDQNFDTYSVEYTFADGAKMFLEGRTMRGCYQGFASHCFGTRGSGIISQNSHSPSMCRLFRGNNFVPADEVWRNPFGRNEPSPYQEEWNHLIAAIRANQPYNEVRRGAEASLVTSMGRMAAHTGQLVTRAQILQSDHEFAPDIDQMTYESPAPVLLGANNRYPTPHPGFELPSGAAGRREYY